MTPVQQNDMIDLFCRYAVPDIMSSKQNEILGILNIDKPEKLNTVEGYPLFYKMISDIAEEVEKILQLPPGELQTKKAIRFLQEKVRGGNEPAIEATTKLIEAKLYRNWSPENQVRYKTSIQLLLNWIHFFISYTNSSTPSVNNSFKNLLKYQFTSSYINSNKEKINLIAALLYKYFKMQKVVTFYDKEKLEWSDDFKDKMFSYSSKSYAFVQFIETEIFTNSPPQNYCYREFSSYKEAIRSFSQTYQLENIEPICFFIISNPQNLNDYKFRPAGDLEIEFIDWANYIDGHQFLTLHTGMSNEELKVEIQKAALKIMEVKKNIFENFLNSF